LAKADEAFHPKRVVRLANWLAKRAVTARLRAEGIAPRSRSAADITRSAKAYLNEHPQLFDEANALAEQISADKHRKRRADRKR
jgi:hypothetical protein